MNNRIGGYRVLAAGLLFVSVMAKAAATIIILDSGHDPLYPGARAACGKLEHLYNDKVVAAFLKATTARVLLTRDPGQPPRPFKLIRSADGNSKLRYTLKASLQARTDWANSNNGRLFISIHHDSVASRFITADKNLCDGKGGHRLLPEFRKKHDIGFNVVIHQDEKSPYYRDSLRFARLLGNELLALGRKPSGYHYFPEDECRTCRPVSSELGVWHQSLYVLRQVQMPVVLIEVGNIVDVEDEAEINTDQFRRDFARALAQAVTIYFASGEGK